MSIGSVLLERIMRRLLYLLTFCVLLVARMASAHKSFKMETMSRILDLNDTAAELLGGALHNCYRTCVAGDVRTCTYEFTLVEYTTMSSLCGDCPYTLEDCYTLGCSTAGGSARQVTLVNYILPGPSIQVCEGDTIRVNMINTLISKSATIHWHGIHQFDTPHMDGTPFLTQCPTPPHNSFQYNFTAKPSGTHMYHSHVGFEDTDGMYGGLVVRVADDPLATYYDYDLAEHLMVIWHWYDLPTANIVQTNFHMGGVVDAYAITVNGLAAREEFEQSGITYMTPRAEFTVTKGYRYRFRTLANTAIYCPIQISVDNHTMIVIASDGASFEPVEVDTFVINAGERYDFVLTADQEVGNYWIRYRGHGSCALPYNTVSTVAILRYEGANSTADPSGTVEYADTARSGVFLGPVGQSEVDYSTNTLINIVDLNSTASNGVNVSGTLDHIIYIEFAINEHNEFRTIGPWPQFNNLTFEYPSIPLLTQYEDITDDMICTEDDDSAKDCVGSYCTCPFVYSVGLNSLVELVVIDMSDGAIADHPLHLHGHYFQVIAMEAGNGTTTVADVKSRNEAGLIDKKFDVAPLKDTLGVPDLGFAVLRFVADNPGYWFFHCHVSAHAEEGMAVVIKVGEHSDMVQRPASFPTCGNWDSTTRSSTSTSSSDLIMSTPSVICTLVFLHLVMFVRSYVSPRTFSY